MDVDQLFEGYYEYEGDDESPSDRQYSVTDYAIVLEDRIRYGQARIERLQALAKLTPVVIDGVVTADHVSARRFRRRLHVSVPGLVPFLREVPATVTHVVVAFERRSGKKVRKYAGIVHLQPTEIDGRYVRISFPLGKAPGLPILESWPISDRRYSVTDYAIVLEDGIRYGQARIERLQALAKLTPVVIDGVVTADHVSSRPFQQKLHLGVPGLVPFLRGVPATVRHVVVAFERRSGKKVRKYAGIVHLQPTEIDGRYVRISFPLGKAPGLPILESWPISH
ncbi:MAG: hypothetical protein KatS3mg008_2260 [Acidimicrobiales bacterium]|nr:MAG: hypothetical protein KatS3mg008_2260 [Acidimicrobiales bacterium]